MAQEILFLNDDVCGVSKIIVWWGEVHLDLNVTKDIGWNVGFPLQKGQC